MDTGLYTFKTVFYNKCTGCDTFIYKVNVYIGCDSMTSSVINIVKPQAKLIGIYDMLGRKVYHVRENEIMIFIYDDGTKEFREWKLEKIGTNHYQGYADGVIGLASGSTSGNAFNWKYDFDLPIGSSKYKVSFDDWMFLQDNNYLVNIATMSKFGITLGKVILFFNKN